MTNTKNMTFQYYLSDLGKQIREAGLDVRRARNAATGRDRDFESGRLLAYNEVVSLMQQQAIAFGISLKDVGLDGIDPDNDLV